MSEQNDFSSCSVKSSRKDCGQVICCPQVDKAQSIKVEITYYLGFILSLYDTLQ